jgi:hypothetical protein
MGAQQTPSPLIRKSTHSCCEEIHCLVRTVLIHCSGWNSYIFLIYVAVFAVSERSYTAWP